MTKHFVIFLCVVGLVGCQSTKPPMPKGKWTAVNAIGFIPPTVTKHDDETITLKPQDTPYVPQFPVAIENTTVTTAVSAVAPIEQKQDSPQ